MQVRISYSLIRNRVAGLRIWLCIIRRSWAEGRIKSENQAWRKNVSLRLKVWKGIRLRTHLFRNPQESNMKKPCWSFIHVDLSINPWTYRRSLKSLDTWLQLVRLWIFLHHYEQQSCKKHRCIHQNDIIQRKMFRRIDRFRHWRLWDRLHENVQAQLNFTKIQRINLQADSNIKSKDLIQTKTHSRQDH